MTGGKVARRNSYSWYVVGVLTLANVSGFVDRQILSLLVVPIERDLGISDTQMSYLIGLSFALFYTVMGLPIARWADRPDSNRRTIMATGVALWSIMTMLCGTASSYARLLVYRVGVGVGEASLSAPSVSVIADYFPRERRASALSTYGLGVFLGSGLAYFIGGSIVGIVTEQEPWVWPIIGEIRPWQSVFFAVGAPGLLVALLVLTIREPRRESSGQIVPLRDAVAYVSRNARTFLTLSLGFALSATVNFGVAAWLATFFIRRHGWSAASAGMMQGVLTMTIGVVGVLMGGRVADRFVRRGLVDGPLRVGMIGALGMLVFATAYPLVGSATLAVGLVAVVNFFAAFPWGAASAGAAEIFPAPIRTQGVALYFFVLNIVSSVLGPTAVALVTDRVFRDPGAVGYSLALVNVVGMSGTLVLLGAGLGAYRRTVGR